MFWLLFRQSVVFLGLWFATAALGALFSRGEIRRRRRGHRRDSL